jgi:DNA repair protein RadC
MRAKFVSFLPLQYGPSGRISADGLAQLSDEELVAVMLRTGTRNKSVLALAGELLTSFNGLRGLLEAEVGALLGISGIGPSRANQLIAILALAERYQRARLQGGRQITDPGETRGYLQLKLSRYDREVFACLYLDNQHRLIAYEELFYGTIDGAHVHPREVVKASLRHNAAAVIFAHNHPSGVAEPSQADQRITVRLRSALELVDIRVLDHMIVGDGEVLSFAEKGLI